MVPISKGCFRVGQMPSVLTSRLILDGAVNYFGSRAIQVNCVAWNREENAEDVIGKSGTMGSMST